MKLIGLSLIGVSEMLLLGLHAYTHSQYTGLCLITHFPQSSLVTSLLRSFFDAFALCKLTVIYT